MFDSNLYAGQYVMTKFGRPEFFLGEFLVILLLIFIFYAALYYSCGRVCVCARALLWLFLLS